MNFLIRSFFLLLFGTVTTIFLYAQNSNSKIYTITSLEQKIPLILDSVGIPGISVALINMDKLVWSKGFGVSNKETGIKVTEQTIFPAASLGKPVFAYAVLKMVDKGKVHLDSTITSSFRLFRGKIF